METSDKMWDAIETLEAAGRGTRRILDEFGLSQDMAYQWAHGESWPIITACYNGLEQALKVLLCLEHGKEVAEARSVLWTRDEAHHLAKLWAKLKKETREEVEEWAEAWVGVHCYAEPKTVEEMFEHIAQGNREGSGLVDWRYALIEHSEKLPRLCPSMMLSTWETLVAMASGRTGHHRDRDSRLTAHQRWLSRLEKEAGRKTVRLADAYGHQAEDDVDAMQEILRVRTAVHQGAIGFVLKLIGAGSERGIVRGRAEEYIRRHMTSREGWKTWSEDWKILIQRRRGAVANGGQTIEWDDERGRPIGIGWELNARQGRKDIPEGAAGAAGRRPGTAGMGPERPPGRAC